MKKLVILIFAVLMAVGISYSTISAASYFSNNKALDGLFKKLEKTFAQYEKDEVIRPKAMEIINDPSEKGDPWKRKKITDKQKEAAADKQLNNLKVEIEILEEELGGFSSTEYKIIIEHITSQLFFARESNYHWDSAGKNISLYLSWDDKYKLNGLKGLEGNFTRMGKEKDKVDPAALKVKGKITRYLNQSIQKGNKVGKNIQEKLPGKIEQLFKTYNLTKIEAAKALAIIHEDIYTPTFDKFDGTDSLEDLMESIEAGIHWIRSDREVEKRLEYFDYPKDEPSSNHRKYITNKIMSNELSETFTYGFKDAITLDELARLYFEEIDTKIEDSEEEDSEEYEEYEEYETDSYELNDNKEVSLEDKIVIEDSSIPDNSPAYIKKAYIYGMIDGQSGLNKTLSRADAAKILVKGAAYDLGYIWDSLSITDYQKVPIADYETIATCIKAGMMLRADKFEPQGNYTKEEAIVDNSHMDLNNIRGFHIPISLSEPAQILVGKNTIHIIFEKKSEIKSYIQNYYDSTILSKIKLTGNYTRVDTGGVLIELYTSDNGIKFTVKKGVTYLDFKEGYYGPGLHYKLEPKVLKSTDKVNMNLQIDSRYKKLYAKLDPIIKKIIKKGMTDKEKVKAIHDYVIKAITYDSRYQNEDTLENLMISIEKGRGVCGDYALLFKHLCDRASIPCVYEAEFFLMQHAWNAVYINGDWRFVDTTWDDDDNGKIKYTYFLVDKYTFMKDHYPVMGIAEPKTFTYVDNMSIQSQEELRGYLLENFYWIDGYKLTFRMADKKIKPIITYMKDYYVNVELKYDASKNLYTVTAKSKK